ncbi:N-acetylmuramoyl-L-alanine amidase [Rossellomorea marisflavi]|uniref:N-acetylmuramoyl-L-alanine amidase n=1 Tax=Rossellomorea marisflavi TaxID=189381 RepID=UPI0009A5BE91|nr:N-acetylmuramoyl-L-alanine amidase [Rossellomorea marisflavi]
MAIDLNYRVDHVQINEFSRPGDELLRLQALVVHYTANPHANAEEHQEFFDGEDGGGGRYAGAHIFVDKDEAVEVIPLNEIGYHANDGGTAHLKLPALRATAGFYPGGNANLLTIGIEMCIEEDGTFHRNTIERTIAVIRVLQERFPQLRDTKNRVVRHYDVTGKICPKPYVDDPAAWTEFLNAIDKVAVKPSVPKPKPVAKPKPAKKGDQDTNSIVTYLNSIGQPSSYSARAKLAKEYGIGNYSGTAAQNLKLLGMVRDGKKVKKQPAYIGKRLESIHRGDLRFYSRASWSDKYYAGSLKYGYGFPKIVDKVKVDGAYQYKVKNSKGNVYYVTASSKYVKFV